MIKLLVTVVAAHTTAGLRSMHCRLQGLQLAREQDVTVVGMGIGFDRTYVPSGYQHWITAGLPSTIPAAFRELLGQDSTSTAAEAAVKVPWEEVLLVQQGREVTCKDIVDNMQPIFQQLHAEADQQKEMKLAPGSMPDTIQLQIVFALDCTGSMQPWIAAARQQIRGITEAILPKVKQAVPEVQLTLKFGLVVSAPVCPWSLCCFRVLAIWRHTGDTLCSR